MFEKSLFFGTMLGQPSNSLDNWDFIATEFIAFTIVLFIVHLLKAVTGVTSVLCMRVLIIGIAVLL